jgi:hypothetical protein
MAASVPNALQWNPLTNNQQYLSDYNMAVWLPLVLIAFAALGVFQYKAHAASVRRTAAFEQERERNLATERLERAIVESTPRTPYTFSRTESRNSRENAAEVASSKE